MGNLQFWKDFLNQVGFPVFFACWLMFRTDKRMDKIVELLHESIDKINKRD